LSLLDAIVLGLVEGVTEFLPISSTGHLILVDEALGQRAGAYEIAVQGGAILAVLLLYGARIARMLRGERDGLRLLGQLAVAFAPSAAVGLWAHEWLEARLFAPQPVLAALFLGGLAMLFFDRRYRGRAGCALEALSWRGALLIGALQVLALWPGMSRSMVTILAGMGVGLSAVAAAEFSFLLGLLTLTAASGYALIDDLAPGGAQELRAIGLAPALLGAAGALVSALLAVRWLVGWLARRGMAAFGWYRIGLTALLCGLWLAGLVSFESAP
jgi:undecaprenyl-diphosphatase